MNKLKVVNVLLILLNTACNNKYNINENVNRNNNEEYLQAPSLHMLTVPSGIILPSQNDNYNIPTIRHNGVVGKKLDIRPPTQPLVIGTN